LFRVLGIEQDDHGLAAVRGATAALGPHHPAHRFLSAYGLTHDAAFVDTFLNRRDVDYTVDGLLRLIESAGLRFQRWANNEWYYPDSHISPANPLFDAISHLPEPAVWGAMELFHAITQHYVVACRDDRSPGQYGIDFESADFSQAVPIIDRMRLRSRGLRFLDTLNPLESSLFRFMDGRRSVAECLRLAGLQADATHLVESARVLMRRLWRMGLLDVMFPEGGAQ
ncbi:MAG: hypothetical protein MUE60_03195, partial [Candidatus Eisenbacteria bacterium]|nr:hypothetical protein [Candidatus Eisenbacteria bacterium]